MSQSKYTQGRDLLTGTMLFYMALPKVQLYSQASFLTVEKIVQDIGKEKRNIKEKKRQKFLHLFKERVNLWSHSGSLNG